MDPAVSLVQAYLYANGFFTVTEYPVVELRPDAEYRSSTDIDILAVRFPNAARLVPTPNDTIADDVVVRMLDPTLECSDERIEFIIGEVKEGRAELNRGATRPHVLRTALARFGYFEHGDIERVVDRLIRHGKTDYNDQARVRLIAFGAYRNERERREYTVVTLHQIVKHLDALFERHAERLSAAQFKDPAIAMLMVLHKARIAPRE
jgi:hypothetical protein